MDRLLNQIRSCPAGDRHVPWRYFGIVGMPILIFLSHSVISDNFMVPDLDVGPEILVPGQGWLEAAGRFRFLAAAWFYCCLAVLAVVLLLRNLTRPMTATTRLAALATLALVVLLSVGPSLTEEISADDGQVYDRLGAAVFNEVLSRGHLPGCEGPEDPWLFGSCGDRPVVLMFAHVLAIVNALAGVSAGALIVGMILC
ncbi:MAG: hypothetical protein AB8B58_12270, partial [Roseobacter sp.]